MKARKEIEAEKKRKKDALRTKGRKKHQERKEKKGCIIKEWKLRSKEEMGKMYYEGKRGN